MFFACRHRFSRLLAAFAGVSAFCFSSISGAADFAGRSAEAPVAAASVLSRIDAALLQDPPHDPKNSATVVELSISSEGARMPAHLYVASGAGPHPTFVLLHGLPGNERNLDVAQALRRFGFNVLYFHYRGAWGADGEYHVSRLADDALAALQFLRDPERAAAYRIDTDALSLIGHSLGGFTALAAGAREPSLACVVALSPANLGVWKTSFESGADATAARLMPYADSLFMLAGFSGQSLADDLLTAPMASMDTRAFGEGLAGKAVLMLVGEDDQVTPADTMFDPTVDAYRQVPGMQLTARHISGDHSFSWSRLRLTRELLGFADQACRGD